MSRSSRQALAMLGAVHGGIRTLRENYATGPEFQALVVRADEACLKVINRWPETGNSVKNTNWVLDKMAIWGHALLKTPGQWTMVILASTSMQALTDLHEKVTNRGKKEALDTLFEPIQDVIDFLEPMGQEAAEHAEIVLSSLYGAIEWED